MTIGLNFVKNIDKNWKKHVQSLDRIKDDKNIEEKIYIFNKFAEKSNPIEVMDEKSDWDYWDYWKKRYFLIR